VSHDCGQSLTTTHHSGSIQAHSSPLSHLKGRGNPLLTLHFTTRSKQRAFKRGPTKKRKAPQTIAPIEGSDSPGGNVSIERVLVRSEPRRVRHNRRFTYVEEFLVQWGPEKCTLTEGLEKYSMGFNIIMITSLDDKVPSTDLQLFVSVKRLTIHQRQKYKTPPLDTECMVQFAPSPQGSAHIRFIADGNLALDTFLATEPQPPPAQPGPFPSSNKRSTPIKRSSSAQAPARTKIRAPNSPLSPQTGKPPRRAPQTFPARPPHFLKSYLLHIIKEEGDPGRIPYPGPASTPLESHPHHHGTNRENT